MINKDCRGLWKSIMTQIIGLCQVKFEKVHKNMHLKLTILRLRAMMIIDMLRQLVFKVAPKLLFPQIKRDRLEERNSKVTNRLKNRKLLIKEEMMLEEYMIII